MVLPHSVVVMDREYADPARIPRLFAAGVMTAHPVVTGVTTRPLRCEPGTSPGRAGSALGLLSRGAARTVEARCRGTATVVHERALQDCALAAELDAQRACGLRRGEAVDPAHADGAALGDELAA